MPKPLGRSKQPRKLRLLQFHTLTAFCILYYKNNMVEYLYYYYSKIQNAVKVWNCSNRSFLGCLERPRGLGIEAAAEVRPIDVRAERTRQRKPG
jgi:hypothetical protein